MKAIVFATHGGPEVLEMREVEVPNVGEDEVLVKVHAAGVNRADLLQRAGHYPAPEGAPKDILGMEYAGVIERVGRNVQRHVRGARVFGLAPGGAYAEYVSVHGETVASLPDEIAYPDAAAVPEAFLTAFDALVIQGKLNVGDTLLVHAVASGVGTAATQLGAALGARVIGTARSSTKLDVCKSLGMDVGLVVTTDEFAKEVLRHTDNQGVDVTLDLVGGRYANESLACTRIGGTIMAVGLVGGTKGEIDLSMLLRKRVTLKGTVMRSRGLEEKIALRHMLERRIVPLLRAKRVRPVVFRTMPLDDAKLAHELLQRNETQGKVVLTCTT